MSDTATLMRYDAQKKSVAVAYLLCLFFGGFGAHRFYLGDKKSGRIMLILTLSSFVLTLFAVQFLLILAITGLWAFADLFTIPRLARDFNDNLAIQLNAGVGD